MDLCAPAHAASLGRSPRPARRRGWRRLVLALALAGLPLLAQAGRAHANELRLGLPDEPDTLDPALTRSFASRIVLASVCDKLMDVSPELRVVPQLATSWSWSEDGRVLTLNLRPGVVFQDGEPFDGAAVKFNIERYLTLPGSLRRDEIDSIDHVDVLDPETVALVLKRPDAALVAHLTDRAGMMLAPKATAKAAPASEPVCSGPFKMIERVAKSRIVVGKFADYWDAGAYRFDRLSFRPIPDAAARLAALRAGTLDLIEGLAPTDVEGAIADPRLQVLTLPGLGFTSIEFRLAAGGAASPIARDARLRQAFDLAIDRDALNRTALNGSAVPADQPFAPSSFYHAPRPVQGRDLSRARALLAAAGVERPLPVAMTVPDTGVSRQVAEAIRAMVAAVGFDLRPVFEDPSAQRADRAAGRFESTLVFWSGRIDPDGNLSPMLACNGRKNDLNYCDARVDALLDAARGVMPPAERKARYAQALALIAADAPILYLYFERLTFGASRALRGFIPYPDGVIRLANVSLER